MAATGVFDSYDLRTTDLEAAQAFYVGVLGWRVHGSGALREFFAGEQRVGTLMALPERARAQGAPAHWLGHIGVDAVDTAVRHFSARGAQQLGPVQQTAQGQQLAILRDPQGAVFALRAGRKGTVLEAVAWHELNTTDLEQAWTCYSEPFGWRVTETLELGPPVGAYRMFTWEDDGRSVGAMANTARLPGVHTHWLFYFAVADLEAAVQQVRTLGGRVLNGPMQVPGGDRVAQCEDPQGAAFALTQPAIRP